MVNPRSVKVDPVKGNSFPEKIYSPTVPIHSINGMRMTRC